MEEPKTKISLVLDLEDLDVATLRKLMALVLELEEYHYAALIRDQLKKAYPS